MSYLIQNIKTTNDLKEKLYTVSKKWLLEHILYKDVKVEQYRRSSLTSEDDKKSKKKKMMKIQFIFIHANA